MCLLIIIIAEFVPWYTTTPTPTPTTPTVTFTPINSSSGYMAPDIKLEAEVKVEDSDKFYVSTY